jgi:hypothetical protein
MKTCGSGGTASPFLTAALDGGELSASCPGRFTPGETSPDTRWIGGWVGPRADLDAVEKRIILPLTEVEHLPSSPWPVAVPTEIFRLHSSSMKKNVGLPILLAVNVLLCVLRFVSYFIMLTSYTGAVIICMPDT